MTTPSTVDRDAIINIQDKSYKLIQNDTKQVESEADAYINQLLIHNVGMKDQGIYACIGMDKRGNSDMKEARLVVIPGASKQNINHTNYPYHSVTSSYFIDSHTEKKHHDCFLLVIWNFQGCWVTHL